MLLRKDSGGTTVNWRGAAYDWPADGSVCDVPVEMAMELLAIHGGGFSEVNDAAEPAGDDEGAGGGGTGDPGEDPEQKVPPKAPAKPRGRAPSRTA